MREFGVIALLAVVSLLIFTPGNLSGQVARHPQPQPEILTVSLRGSISDSTGERLPPGRLVAETFDGVYIGQGGVTLQDYTVTLTYGWHELVEDSFVIKYEDYQERGYLDCTTVSLEEVFRRIPYRQSRSVWYEDLECVFQ